VFSVNFAKMMVTSEETIQTLKNECLRLKLIVHEQNRILEQNGRPPGGNMDETKRDLIADLMMNNDELRTRIEELEEQSRQREMMKKPEVPRPRVVKVDAGCQTNLDRLNIDQLIEASLTLKKQKRQQLQQLQAQQQQMLQAQQQQQLQAQQQQQLQAQHQQERHQQHNQERHHQQQFQSQPFSDYTDLNHQYQLGQQSRSNSQQTQQYFQNQFQQQEQPPPPPLQSQQQQRHDPLPQHNLEQQHQGPKDFFTPTIRHMSADEKESLDKLFKLDGLLTTARDRLRAVAFN
jgi:hypothetical protein